MARINWSANEKNDMAVLAYKIRQNDLTISDVECVRLAMKALMPPEKHRYITQFSVVRDWVLPVWRSILDGSNSKSNPETVEGSSEKQPATASSPVPITNKKEEWPSAIHPVVRPECERVHDSSMSAVESLSTEALLSELTKRLTTALDPNNLKILIHREVNTILEHRLPDILKGSLNSAPEIIKEVPQKEKKPKVAVIGLLPGQVDLIKHEYGDEIDVHFFDGGEGGSKLKSVAQVMDLTIRTKWAKGQVPKIAGIPNFIHASGMDSIRSILFSRFHVKPHKS